MEGFFCVFFPLSFSCLFSLYNRWTDKTSFSLSPPPSFINHSLPLLLFLFFLPSFLLPVKHPCLLLDLLISLCSAVQSLTHSLFPVVFPPLSSSFSVFYHYFCFYFVFPLSFCVLHSSRPSLFPYLLSFLSFLSLLPFLYFANLIPFCLMCERQIFPLLLFGFLRDLLNLGHLCSFWSTETFFANVTICEEMRNVC